MLDAPAPSLNGVSTYRAHLLDLRLARRADVVVPAKRGRQGRVALHGATLVVLEAIVLGLAIANPADAVKSLPRIGAMRDRLRRIEDVKGL